MFPSYHYTMKHYSVGMLIISLLVSLDHKHPLCFFIFIFSSEFNFSYCSSFGWSSICNKSCGVKCIKPHMENKSGFGGSSGKLMMVSLFVLASKDEMEKVERWGAGHKSLAKSINHLRQQTVSPKEVSTIPFSHLPGCPAP